MSPELVALIARWVCNDNEGSEDNWESYIACGEALADLMRQSPERQSREHQIAEHRDARAEWFRRATDLEQQIARARELAARMEHAQDCYFQQSRRAEDCDCLRGDLLAALVLDAAGMLGAGG